jgi:hypothetical protein
MMSFSVRVIVRPPRPQPALHICVPAAYRIEWPKMIAPNTFEIIDDLDQSLPIRPRSTCGLRASIV